ncbi:MAG: hypothetical protein IKY45_01225, partial [Clostridia bacterium]|nr:hypothetical protein [Clostridia bacterium]
SSNDYTDFEKTKIRLIDYRNIDTFIEDGFYIVYEDGPGMYDKYWTLYPLIQTSMFTGEEIEYTQVKYTAYGIAKRMSYGTADNYGAWERNDIVDVRDSLTSSEKNAALSANMGKVLNETKADADKWERIANASLTEDVTSLIIQNEPDGTPYNFKKMKVFITMPSGGNGNAYFQIKNGSNSSVAYFLLTHTKAYCEMYIEGGYAFAKTRSNTGEYSQFTNASSGVPMDCFNKVHIGANGTILAGTKFEIWGVRNK